MGMKNMMISSPSGSHGSTDLRALLSRRALGGSGPTWCQSKIMVTSLFGERWHSWLLKYISCLNFETLTVLWRYPGVNLMPSAKNIRGQDSRNESTVITEKRFMSSITSCIRLDNFNCYYSSLTGGTINLMKENSPCHRQGVSCWGRSSIGWSDWTPWRSKTRSWFPDKITVSTVKIPPIIWVPTAKKAKNRSVLQYDAKILQ